MASTQKLPTAPQPQVSLAYWSRNDERQDKFGISIGIKGSSLDQGGLKAVLMGTVATSSTRTLGDAPRNAFVVLIGGTDALTDPVEKRQPYVVMSHPSYQRGDEAFRIDKLPFDPEQQGGGWYFDPVRRERASFSGPWLAGWARVEGSHFWIIVQRRDHIGYAYITATLVSLLAAGLVLAWKGVLRLREPGNQASWERG